MKTGALILVVGTLLMGTGAQADDFADTMRQLLNGKKPPASPPPKVGAPNNVKTGTGASATPTPDRSLRPVAIPVKDGSGKNQPGFMYSGSYALLIGNYHYENSVWPELPTVQKELEDLADILKRQGFALYRDQIHYNLKSEELRAILRDFIDDFGAGDASIDRRLFVMYSGHGETLRDRGYLVPVDAPGTSPDDRAFIRKGVEFSFIEGEAKRADAKHVLFCFDSCFAGNLFSFRDQATVPPEISRLTGDPAREFMTAGSKNERVPGASYFTPFLIKGLRGYAAPGKEYVTALQLYSYLRDQVTSATGGANQPQFGPLDRTFTGDVVFQVDPETTPEPRPAAPQSLDALFSKSQYATRSASEQRDALKVVQTVLAQRQLYSGAPDGLLGPRTANAIYAWQRQQGLAVNGQLDDATLKSFLDFGVIPGEAKPSSATKASPFRNSLGMLFVPVPNTHVLFSIWETRNRDYQTFLRETGRAWNRPSFQQTEEHPAVNVSWEDAVAFCEWLSKREHAKYRLPTDEEWSMAVGLENEPGRTPEEKSRKLGGYPWGTEWPPPVGAGNYADETAQAKHSAGGRADNYIHGYNDGYAWTAPVGTYHPNALGICDLGGNAAEWVTRWNLAEGPEGIPHVLRGASWDLDDKSFLLSSCRLYTPPEGRGDYTGFRCVLVITGD